jgi:hypothetical protein
VEDKKEDSFKFGFIIVVLVPLLPAIDTPKYYTSVTVAVAAYLGFTRKKGGVFFGAAASFTHRDEPGPVFLINLKS